MNNSKKYLLYALYVLGIAVFFGYYLFPSDMVAAFIMRKAEQANPDIQLGIQKIHPTFPPGVSIQSITVVYKDNPVFRAINAKLSPHFFSLLTSKRSFRYGLKTQNGKGEIIGRASIEEVKNSRVVRTRATLSNIPLNQLDILKKYENYKVSGFLDGEVDYEGESGIQMQNSSANFEISGFALTLPTPVPLINLERFDFRRIVANLSMKGQQIQINKCLLRGRDMDGEISGSISIRRTFEKSMLNISGVLKPHPEFMAKINTAIPQGLISPSRLSTSGLPFRITGTIDNPKFFLR